jgi:hypothetical protein
MDKTEDMLPSGSAALASGSGSSAIWIAMALAIVFIFCLIVGGILTWQQNRRRNGYAVKSGFIMSAIKKFLRWLFFPSFQHFFADDDFTNAP